MSQVTSTSDTRVLVVDDNLLNRKLVCAILKNYDLKYDIAENGKIALDLFLTHKYNLVLMDIQMPIMNGIDCTSKIRKHERESNIQSPTPIIAVTAFVLENDKENCFNAGMNEFIAKPFKAEDLVEIMSKYIELKSIA
jgi:CheY-like chemotaxis protein